MSKQPEISLVPLPGSTAYYPHGYYDVSGEGGPSQEFTFQNNIQGVEYLSNYQAGDVNFQPVSTDAEANGGMSYAPPVLPHPDHKDVMGRPEWIPAQDNRDRYLKPRDGRLALLTVQSTVHSPTDMVSWERNVIKDATPPSVKLVYWCMESVPELTQRQPIRAHASSYMVRGFMSKEWRNEYFSRRWLKLYGRWIPACFGLLVLLISPKPLEGQIRNNGFYDPVRYRYWGYAKAARNEHENKRSASGTPPQERRQEPGGEWDEEFDNLPARHLRPRYLCFLREDQGYDVTSVKDVIDEFGRNADLEYILVSYTRAHFKTWEDKGKRDVCQIAEKAAREAKVPAFWLDFECTPGSTQAEDIHRICDIVRGCHSVVIALSPSRPGSDSALIEWGARIWTLPELLLCPSEPKIAIYTLGSESTPEYLEKRNFAVRAWEDAKAVRQLIDHYEGSLILTPLELVTIALQCMHERLDRMRREPHYRQWAPGDMSYALMGLLRRRPRVNSEDTDFEAFARLSLANDSNLLLERLICMLPPQRGMPWQKIEDAWGVRLWDIYPTCQIAGIGENQTVILDGAYGATIRWKSLAPVAYIQRNTLWRTCRKLILRGAPLWFLIGLLTLATSASAHIPIHQNPGGIVGIFIFLFAMAIILSSPYLLLSTYRGKFWGTQAWFFGIEGHVPIGDIERNLFGIDLGRLKWSTNGSILSEHREARGASALVEECEGAPPKILESQFQNAPIASPTNESQERLFTLVDTYSMTVTLFRAVRPPVAVMICGREGGMQRAVLCSYDWRTQTFCRETVLRIKTMVIEKLFRVDRFRFSLVDGHKFRQEVMAAGSQRPV